MWEFIDKVRQILSGRVLLDNQIKYKALGLAMSVVHFFFGITQLYLHIYPLFWYNMGVTVFYFFFSWFLAAREHYLAVYVSIFVEVLFYASFATVLLGWDWGFMLYTAGLIPVSFYLSYTLPGIERRLSFPVITSLGVALCYICVDVITRHIIPMYSEGIPVGFITFFHYFNSVLLFIFLVLFATFFALEVRYMQHLLERENDRLGVIANYDPLTKLLNRRSMEVYLKQALEQASSEEPFCLMMTDIDDFKKVNDTYGHDVGDVVLKRVSKTLSENVRESDQVCRWGGEEFLVLFRTDLVHAGQVAERIRENIAKQSIDAKGKQISVTITMGIAQYQEDASISTLINAADENLYYGKKNGKNQVVI